jgi:hypothetical protein
MLTTPWIEGPGGCRYPMCIYVYICIYILCISLYIYIYIYIYIDLILAVFGSFAADPVPPSANKIVRPPVPNRSFA